MTAHATPPAFLAAWDACAQRAGQPLPAAVVEGARRSVFDTLATTAAGVGENCTRAARGACEGESVSPVDAALVLGTASHALDYDDVCMLATCHPSAPVLSARDDTFTIRSCGEARDATGKVLARAWCEATVRRTREFVDPADAPDITTQPAAPANQTFGRRFKVLSCRWLNAGEV